MSPYVWVGEVPLELVDRPEQPGGVSERPEEFAKLVEDIKRRGILVPLRVIKVRGRYRVYDGKSRWLAAKQLGFKTVPVTVLWEFA